MIQRPTGTLAALGVSGSVMLCQDFQLRECALIQRPTGTLAVLGVSGSVMLCQDFQLRVCVDPRAHGYFGSAWCEWFCDVVSGFSVESVR